MAVAVARVALLVFGIVLALLAGEGALRLLVAAPTPTPSHQHYYQADAEMGYDIAPNFPPEPEALEDGSTREMWSNELGCFDTPVARGTPYVLLVGDSFTHGSTRFENNWGTVLESRLGHRVLKCGIPGVGTRQELIKARRIIARMATSPTLIVLGWFPNDLEDDVLFPRMTVLDGWQVIARTLTDRDTGAIETLDRAALEDKLRHYERQRACLADSALQHAKCALSAHSRLYTTVAASVRTLATRSPAVASVLGRTGVVLPAQESPIMLAFDSPAGRPWMLQAWRRHLEGFTAFKALAREQHAPLLVVLLPTNFQVYPFLAAGHRVEVERPDDVVAAYLEAQRIEHLDLLPVLRARADTTPRGHLDPVRDLYYRTDMHFNRRGNILTGLTVAEYIAERGLLPAADALPRIREELRRLERAGSPAR